MMAVLLALALVLLALVPADAQTGLLIRFNCTTDITNPVTNQTWCFDATSGQVKVWNGSNYVAAGGGGVPGGADTQVQFNSTGNFAGSASFTFANGILLTPRGTQTNPGLVVGPNTGYGFFFDAGNSRVGVAAAGVPEVDIGSGVVRVASTTQLQWSSSDPITAGNDLILRREAANTLSLRNGTNQQALRIYGGTAKYLNASHDGTNGVLGMIGGGNLKLSGVVLSDILAGGGFASCLQVNSSGVIGNSGAACGTGGAGAGVTSINALTGALLLNGTASQVTVNQAGNTFTLATPQDISNDSNVEFSSVRVQGPVGPGSVIWSDGAGTPHTVTFKSSATNVNTTWTLPGLDSVGQQCFSSDGAGKITWQPCTMILAGSSPAAGHVAFWGSSLTLTNDNTGSFKWDNATKSLLLTTSVQNPASLIKVNVTGQTTAGHIVTVTRDELLNDIGTEGGQNAAVNVIVTASNVSINHVAQPVGTLTEITQRGTGDAVGHYTTMVMHASGTRTPNYGFAYYSVVDAQTSTSGATGFGIDMFNTSGADDPYTYGGTYPFYIGMDSDYGSPTNNRGGVAYMVRNNPFSGAGKWADAFVVWPGSVSGYVFRSPGLTIDVSGNLADNTGSFKWNNATKSLELTTSTQNPASLIKVNATAQTTAGHVVSIDRTEFLNLVPTEAGQNATLAVSNTASNVSTNAVAISQPVGVLSTVVQNGTGDAVGYFTNVTMNASGTRTANAAFGFFTAVTATTTKSGAVGMSMAVINNAGYNDPYVYGSVGPQFVGHDVEYQSNTNVGGVGYLLRAGAQPWKTGIAFFPNAVQNFLLEAQYFTVQADGHVTSRIQNQFSPDVGADPGSFLAQDATGLAAGRGGIISFGGVYNNSGNLFNWAAIAAPKDNGTSNDTRASLAFYVRPNFGATYGDPKMQINNDGGVQIGLPSGGSQGASTLNVASTIYVNGFPVAGLATNIITSSALQAGNPIGGFIPASVNVGGAYYVNGQLAAGPVGGSLGLVAGTPTGGVIASAVNVNDNYYVNGNPIIANRATGAAAFYQSAGRLTGSTNVRYVAAYGTTGANIQSAIDDVGAGGIVQLDCISYTLSAKVTIQKRITLQGCGEGTVLTGSASPMVEVTTDDAVILRDFKMALPASGTGITIAGVTAFGNEKSHVSRIYSTNGANPIVVSYGVRITLTNLNLQDFTGSGIEYDGGGTCDTASIIITDSNLVGNNTAGSVGVLLKASAAILSGLNIFLVERGVVGDSTPCIGQPSPSLVQLTIVSSQIVVSQISNSAVIDIVGSHGGGFVISGNNIGSIISSGGVGIRFGASGDGAQITNSVISNNSFDVWAGKGIAVQSVVGLSITGNSYDCGPNTCGPFVDGGSNITSGSVTISGTQFLHQTEPYYTGSGFAVQHNAPGVSVANLGSWDNGSTVYCSNCTIANPCAGGGSGALAKRLNGVWVCN